MRDLQKCNFPYVFSSYLSKSNNIKTKTKHTPLQHLKCVDTARVTE